MSGTWSSRELDIVETLSRRVRLLATSQILQIWWPTRVSDRRVNEVLRRLVRGGLLQRVVVNAHPLLSITRPLAAWTPGSREPDFERISKLARTRWRDHSIPHEVFFASKLAANVFGSDAGTLTPINHRDHDLLLGQVYARFRQQKQRQRVHWIGEDSRPKAGYRIKDPDAFLVDSDGRTKMIVESAGRYSIKQCASFHTHCEERELPYELW